MIHADTRKVPLRRLLAASAMAVLPATAMAAELEITHW